MLALRKKYKVFFSLNRQGRPDGYSGRDRLYLGRTRVDRAKPPQAERNQKAG